MVTIKDVAKMAGVSISTASYALNNDSRITKETKERVLEMARKLNYYPNAAARNLKRKKTNIIGVFVNDFGGPIFSNILEGIHKELINNNYNIIVSSGESGRNLLLERQVDGAIILDRSLDDDLLKRIAGNGCPLVILDRRIEGTNIYESMIDNESIVYQLTTEMIDKGYKKIGYVSGVIDSYDNLHRFKGLINAVNEHGLTTRYYYKGDFTKSGGYNIGKEIIHSNDFPEYIFCANDEMAVGLLDALKEENIKVPEQIAIAGFDNIDLTNYCEPPITTVEVNHQKWGKEVASALINILSDKEITEIYKPKGKIIYRKSC